MWNKHVCRTAVMLVALAGSVRAVLRAAPRPDDERPNREGVDFFEKKIRPLLVRHCYECHSGDADKAKGKFVLDTHEGLRRGGQSGAAVVPGNAAESLLIEAIRYEGLEMPPKQKLPDEAIADFVRWVELGVPDPRIGKAARPRDRIPLEEARTFWSLQKVRETPPPRVENTAWPRIDIDQFILAALEQKALKPVADSSRESLIRRVTFDLIGLPPTPEEIDAFLHDSSESAFATVVDRLLASPQFGERWGRHWLDVARYGESTGKERNLPYRFAWRYRDWVVDAFNADKPYDEFILEQLAGDLLPAANDAQRSTRLIATGFLAIGPRGINEKNEEQFRMDVVDDQIDAATRGILGLTVACARCHDHKFDPIPTADYYALAGVFRSTETFSGVGPGKRNAGDRYLLALADSKDTASPGHIDPKAQEARQKEIAETEAELADLRSKFKQVRRQSKQKGDRKAKAASQADAGNADSTSGESLADGNDPDPAIEDSASENPIKNKKDRKRAKAAAKKKPGAGPKQANRLKKRIQQLENELAELKEAPIGELVMGVRDARLPTNCHLLVRGDLKEAGPEVPRGGLSVFNTVQLAPIRSPHSGRLEFAQWVVSRDNPLTARVMVNRVWQKLFGNGLVETVDNFGMLGEEPSHPKLLDALAARFMADHWSVKRLMRSIVLSRVYQLGSQHEPKAFDMDPANRLLWRMEPRRLDAEEIRDALLAIGGNLEVNRPVGSPVTQLGINEIGRGKNAPMLPPPAPVRSLYLPIVRNMVPEVLSVFDMADPSLIVGKRDVTNVATQSLFLLNNPLVLDQSDAMARRLLDEVADDEPARIDRAYLLALGRRPKDPERARAVAFLDGYRQSLDQGAFRGDAQLAAWSTLCQTLIASAEFRYLY
jgi:hypothetical protein